MSAEKSFEIECTPAYARLGLDAQLNAFHWADIERSATEILAALEAGKARFVIVDLSTLDYLGSAQVALLLRVWKSVKARDGKLIVQVTAPVVREVLKTAGLTALWEFTETREGAFQILGLRPDGRRKRSLSAVLPIVGCLALAAALGLVCISIWKATLVDSKVSLAAVLSCSAVALAAGLWTAVRGGGLRRVMGAGMIVAGLLLAAAGYFNSPLRTGQKGRQEQVSEKTKARGRHVQRRGPR